MREAYTRYPRPLLWLVPGGTVTVGGDEADARPRFTVEVEPFYLSKVPVTNEQFEAFDPGYLRADHAPEDDDPAVGVSYEDAAAYCRWYAEVSRKPMRLPTEVEWEHACRGGASGRLYLEPPETLDQHAWHAGNSDPRRLPRLRDKRYNPFGLYAMLGGVWEWTASLYRPYPLDDLGRPPEDAGEPSPRVLRGGSFRTPPEQLSCSLRRAADPRLALPDAGFRVAKSLR